MTTRTYTVTDPVAFHALYLPLPPDSDIFLFAAGEPNVPTPPPGVLLAPGFHYLAQGGSFVLGSQIGLNAGDLVQVKTYS